MGDELFLRSRCSEGAGCHCSGMEHFYVPDSTDRAPQTSSRNRRPSLQAGGTLNDSMHSAKSAVRPTLARTGGSVSQTSCTAALLASVFDQVSGAPADGRQVRSRRVSRSSRPRPEPTEAPGDTSGLPDRSYLAYSSDDEYEDFMKKPRTDYTYSRSLSYKTFRPEEVGPPSMSRLGLHSPGHGAGDSPVLGRTEHSAPPGRSRRTAAGLGEAAASPALAGGGEQGVYESTTSRVYSYRREITSHVSSASLPSAASVAPPLSFVYSSSPAAGGPSVPPSSAAGGPSLPPSPPSARAAPRPDRALGAAVGSSALSPSSPTGSQNSAESSRPTPSSEDTLLDLDFTGAVHGISAGLDADSQDEEWLPTDGPSKLGSNRCSTPYKTHADWSAQRGARLALSPLLRLWLLLTAVCRHLWSAVRPLLLTPVTSNPALPGSATTNTSSLPAKTLPEAAAAPGTASSRAGAEAGVTAGRPGEERRDSRPPSRSRHRYQLRPRLTPLRDALPTDWPAAATGAGAAGLNGRLTDGQTAGWTDSSGYVSHSSHPSVSGTASAAAPGSSQPGRLVTALAWLAAVLWFVNPLRWAAAVGRAAISRSRMAAEVLDLPRGAATVVAALSPAAWLRSVQKKLAGSADRQSRPGWLPSLGALLWGPAATAATSASSAAPPGSGTAGSGTRAELWRRSRSQLDGAGAGAGSRAGPSSGGRWSGKTAAGAAEVAGSGALGGARRRCLPGLRTAVLLGLLLLLTLLLLPIIGWLGRDQADGEASAEHSLLPADWWVVRDSAGQVLTGGLSSLAGGLSSLVGGLSSVGVYVVSAVKATAAQLGGMAGSAVALLWLPASPGPAATPAAPASVIDAASEPVSVPASATASVPASESDPRLSTVLFQLDELKSRVDLLQSEYQSCRAASEHSSSSAAVRAALGLSPDSAAPATTERLAAAEQRLQRRLEAELAAVSALLRRPAGPDPSDGRQTGPDALAALLARLTALEDTLPAAERRRDAAERAADVRLDSLAAEMEQLRADIAQLHRSLAAARAGLKQAGSCCGNGTEPDWSGLLGAQIGRLQSHLEGRMQLYSATIRRDLTSEVSALTGAGGGGGGGGISRQEALDIAQRELALYDADKTGKFDFALESAGGSIVSTKCTEAYTVRSARLTVLGVPLWYPSNNPRSIIQPHMQPGECFAFHGEGQFVVGLSRPVRPSEFVIEHIARELTPGGRIDSAPRHCSVLGVGDDGEAALLATFEYSASGAPLQRFAAAPAGRAVSAVELRVSSNWGHPEYTCLYRFRVHGQPEPEGEGTSEEEEAGNR